MNSTALDGRAGLPQDLRQRLITPAREAWSGHADFAGAASFWLERHATLLTLHRILLEEAEAHLRAESDVPAYRRRLSRLGGEFVGQLHEHHNVEEHHYFPRFRAQERQLGPAFDLLDRDHQQLDGGLHSLTAKAEAALGALAQGQSAKPEVASFHNDLEGFGRILVRHLADEEEIVIPVLLKYA